MIPNRVSQKPMLLNLPLSTQSIQVKFQFTFNVIWQKYFICAKRWCINLPKLETN